MNWLWFLLGVITGLLWLGGLLVIIGYRTIIREKQPPATMDDVIVRDIGTLTYSRRKALRCDDCGQVLDVRGVLPEPELVNNDDQDDGA